MTATHDPALCARLIAEHRSTSPSVSSGWTQELYDNLAEQLEAAGQEVERMSLEGDGILTRTRTLLAERDGHRATLNRIADRLRVVHEDPKIAAAVRSVIDERDHLRSDLIACQSYRDTLIRERDESLAFDRKRVAELDAVAAERDALRAEVDECKARIRDHEEQHERALNDQRGLRAEANQLSARLGRIAERCRNTPGKCFCEAHMSDQQGSCPVPDPNPMSPERLAEIETLCRTVHQRNASVKFGDPRYVSTVNSKELFGLVTAIPELLAEVRRLSASLHLAARITSFSSEPCPLCLSLAGESEICSLHHEIDEMGHHAARHAKRIAALEVEVGEAKLVIEQQDRDLERTKTRIAALETGLMEATNWIADRSSEESILVNRLRAIIGGEP